MIPYKKSLGGFMNSNSRFDAGLLEVLVESIVVALIIVFTVGLGTPWAICHHEKWLASKTTLDGKQLEFTGTGTELFGQYLIWLILTFLTVGIYGLWVNLNLKKWIIARTHLK